ncbi:MAG: hypothetical protein JXP34_23655 [Planctomycetes bacterium]|nr:hypothetical protein [Planctomycetota bacterium]
MPDESLWLFAVQVEDAPGSLMDVVSTFAYRGVSIESVLGFGRSVCDAGLVLLTIRCSEKRARAIERVVGRLPVVAAVGRHTVPAEPGMRMVLLEWIAPWRRDDGGPEIIALTPRWILAVGAEPVVRNYLRGGIDCGEIGKHVEVLLPEPPGERET